MLSVSVLLEFNNLFLNGGIRRRVLTMCMLAMSSLIGVMFFFCRYLITAQLPLRLSCPADLSFLRVLIKTIISFFPGGSVLISRSCSASEMFASAVGGSRFNTFWNDQPILHWGNVGTSVFSTNQICNLVDFPLFNPCLLVLLPYLQGCLSMSVLAYSSL